MDNYHVIDVKQALDHNMIAKIESSDVQMNSKTP